MKIKEEPVRPSEFKKRVSLQGIDNLQDALNVLRLTQEWRTSQTCLSLDDLGLSPSLITAALHYVLGKFHANAPLYKCEFCRYCKEDRECTAPTNNCTYERISDEI